MTDLKRHTFVSTHRHPQAVFISPLLKRGSFDQRTDVFFLLKSGAYAAVMKLINEKNCDPNQTNLEGQTLAHCAIAIGNINLVKYLIEVAKADPTAVDAERNTLFHQAAFYGSIPTLELLYHRNPELAQKGNSRGDSPLHVASDLGQLAAVRFLVLNAKMDLLAENSKGETSFHCAASRQHQAVVLFFSTYLRQRGTTVWHCAAKEGRLTTLTSLHKLTQVEWGSKDNQQRTPLHLGVTNNHLGVVAFFVQHASQTIVAQNQDGLTPLHLAAFWGNEAILESLLAAKINPDVPDRSGSMPIHIAVRWGHLKIVKLLIDGSSDVSQKDGDANTPLHLAAEYNRLEIAKCLIKHGAHIKEKNRQGETAIDKAGQKKHIEVFEYLVYVKRLNSRILIALRDQYSSILGQEGRGLLEKTIKVNQRRERLRNTLTAANQGESHNQTYQLDEKELLEAINQGSCEDVLETNVLYLKRCFNQTDTLKIADIAALVRPLIPKILHPAKLLDRKYLSRLPNLKNVKGVYYQRSRLFKTHIAPLIERIMHVVSKIPDRDEFEQIRNILKKIAGYYHSYCKKLTESSEERQRSLIKHPVRLLGIGQDGQVWHRFARWGLCRRLFHADKNNAYGSHQVAAYKGVHWKMFPHAPGIEAAINSLNNLLVGRGFPPTKLLKMVDENGHHYAVLASKSVEGIELQDIVVQHKHLIKKCELQSFSQSFVSSLLTNPQDGKPDNYMAKFKKGTNKIWTIESIDNDIAFAPTAIRVVDKDGKPIRLAFIRNVFFFFPQMKQQISKLFAKSFCRQSAEILLVEWLASLQQKNAEYDALIQQEVFVRSEYEGNESVYYKATETPYRTLKRNKRGLQLPIKFRPNTVRVVYNRIRIIQKLMKENPKMTHEELFEKLEPDLCQHYNKLLEENNGDIYKSILNLYNLWDQVIEAKDEPKSMSGPKIDPLTKIALSSASDMDFEAQRIQTVTGAAEELIATFKWVEFKPTQAQLYLKSIQKLSFISVLTFNECTHLSDLGLIKYLEPFKELKKLVLKGKTSLTMAGLRSALNYYNELVIEIELSSLRLPLEKNEDYQEVYAWLGKCGERLVIFKGGLKMRLSQKFGAPELLLHQLISDHYNHYGLFSLLLSCAKRGPNLRQRDNSTFLHTAAEAKNVTVYDWLVKAGGDPNLLNNKGVSAESIRKQVDH